MFPPAPDAGAAITLSLQPTTELTPGSTIRIGVFAAITSPDGNNQLSSFNLPMDIGPDGRGLGSFIGFNTEPIRSVPDGRTIVGDPDAFTAELFGYDILVSDTSTTDWALSSTPTKLFDLALDLDVSAAGQDFTVAIDDIPNVFSVGGASLVPGGVAPVTVTAVPEPASWLLLFACGPLVRRWRAGKTIRTPGTG